MAFKSGRVSRIASYPKCFLSCHFEASKYASCVSSKDDLKKDDCRTEFIKLKQCFQKAVKNLVKKS